MGVFKVQTVLSLSLFFLESRLLVGSIGQNDVVLY